MVGTDFHALMIEHCMIQKEKYPIENCELSFEENDFVNRAEKIGTFGSQFDISTFGFEVTLELLRTNESLFRKDSHLIVPISTVDFDREQDFKVL